MTRPLGRKYYRSPHKKDCHPRHGRVNWWEDIISPNKAADKLRSRRFIQDEMDDLINAYGELIESVCTVYRRRG